MKSLKRYIGSIICAIAIIAIFFAAPICILRRLNSQHAMTFKEFYPAITAIGGFLFSIPIRQFWKSYMEPVLDIRKGIELRIFNPPGLGGTLQYNANRIIVKNIGRSAAKNCKGYILTDVGKERICWTVPKERPNATINAKDEEALDSCAFLINYKPGIGTFPPPKIIAPTEEGWDNPPRILNGLKECEVLVTAENANPISKVVRLNIEEGVIKIVN